jgi:hypothetical protein
MYDLNEALRQKMMKKATSTLRDWWADHWTGILRLAIVLMVLAATIRLGNEFSRLLWESGRAGAIDLKLRHDEVHRWFDGRPVYSELKSAVYPPASYVILWPLLGWLAVTPARFLWAATTVVSLAWLVYLMVQESGATTHLERMFVALLPLSLYATSATIGSGQLIVHLLPILVLGLLLMSRHKPGWREDLLPALLVLISHVKPSVSVPFFWVVLFVPGRLRPGLLITCGYVAVTLFATSFQEPGFLSLLHDWIARSAELSAQVTRWSHSNLHSWLVALGLEKWNFPASLLALMALGCWTYCHRQRDLWLLLGVVALVARIWTYHGLYDDLLILLPMIALFRITKQEPSDGGSVVAGVMLGITWLATLAPAHLLSAPPPWDWLFKAGQTVVWAAVLTFLLQLAGRAKCAGVGR